MVSGWRLAVKVAFPSAVHSTGSVAFTEMNVTVTGAPAASAERVPVAVMFSPRVTVMRVALKSVIVEGCFTVKFPAVNGVQQRGVLQLRRVRRVSYHRFIRWGDSLRKSQRRQNAAESGLNQKLYRAFADLAHQNQMVSVLARKRLSVIQKHVLPVKLAARVGYTPIFLALKIVAAHIALVAVKAQLPRQRNVIHGERFRVAHQIKPRFVHVQRVWHAHPQLYVLAVGHELVSPTSVKHWRIGDFAAYRVRVPPVRLNVLDYHESSLFSAIAFAGVIHYYKRVVARGGRDEKWLVNCGAQVLRKPCRFGVHAFQLALRVIDVDVIVGFRRVAGVHPRTVTVYVIAVVRLQRADNGIVLPYRDLGFVKVNGEHGLLHVSQLAQ